MANNYRQFSFALQLNNKKESAWCTKTLTKLSNTEDEDHCSGTDFEWTVYPTQQDPSENPSIWFRDNGEYGNVEQIAAFVEKYLKKFQPNGYFLMTWADICSKHRIGEFGGGLVVVTAKEQFWFEESLFVGEHTKTLTNRNST